MGRAMLPLERGEDMARCIHAMIACKSLTERPADFAARRWGPSSTPATTLRAAMNPGTISDGDWAAPLADAASVARQWFGAIKDRSVLGRISFLRRLPMLSRVATATQGATGFWTGEARPKPICELKFSESALKPRKASAIVVLSNELAQHEDPEADGLIREILTNAVVEVVDKTFLSADVGDEDQPSGIANGIAPIASVDPEADLAALVSAFAGDYETATIVASGATFAAFAGPAHPDITVRGGTLGGFPAVASKWAGDALFLLDGAGIGIAGGSVEVDTSEHGSLEMSDSPTGGAVAMMSLWQNDLIATRVEQYVNWTVGRAGSVSWIEGIAYP